MTFDEIKELIRLVNESGIAELELERGDARVRIQRTGTETIREVLSGAHMAAPAAVAAPVAAAPTATAAAPAALNEKLYTVKSPIVGTYYAASSPDAAPFVKPGDVVTSKSTVCIIESMKLMNEIEAEQAGTIVACLVENGKPVEYGEALFTIRPH
ncbi:MAG: acetyl-CoA carboxylase biotin carboxyl carrier protein [Bryobacter sp.]|nr:acetyl-CoA carboxylase biotin carboxyl carrier protein [Bryobacter sp.]